MTATVRTVTAAGGTMGRRLAGPAGRALGGTSGTQARRLIAAAALFGLAGAVGCDCRAKVTAMSTVLGDVRVQIVGAGGLCGGTPALGDFEVVRGSSEVVWSAAFPASSNYPIVGEIKYGTPPPGFTEEKPAAPLAPNDAIEFRVHGPSLRGGVALVVTAR
jgi:hypothetical protein